MTREKLGRIWHSTTFVVAVVALVLQLILILAGQNVLVDEQNVVRATAVATTKVEQVRRFLSYFTIQSNFLVAVAVLLIILRRIDNRFFRVVRLAALIGITVTGVVAYVALPPSPNYSTGNLICDRLLHIVVPLLTFVGWIVFGPRGFVRSGDILPALAWPVVWLIATLALGPVVDWYPYPFLNVSTVGFGRVLLNSTIVAVLFLALAALARWADGRLPGRESTPRTTGAEAG
ncbi:hypothetical protein ABIB25_000244 [Nakamurella sp. UYEF19]|uniref:Pr6Pr family membrane protein n=1 Tax=Nakamurella sp. UYEF19 TaxID=1756392 RepID=UPI0033923F2C